MTRPQEGLETAELLAAGWPDEDVTVSAGADRVYQAVSELRSLGLEGLIERDPRGYFLQPDVRVGFADAPVD